MTENNKNNPGLFSTISKLTNNQAATEAQIPSAYSSIDFMNFFNNKIESIRHKIQNAQHCSAVSYKPNLDLECSITTTETLESFTLLQQTELVQIISSSKTTTCILDPIPTGLLKDVLPEITKPFLSIINSSLSLGYVPKSLKLFIKL